MQAPIYVPRLPNHVNIIELGDRKFYEIAAGVALPAKVAAWYGQELSAVVLLTAMAYGDDGVDVNWLLNEWPWHRYMSAGELAEMLRLYVIAVHGEDAEEVDRAEEQLKKLVNEIIQRIVEPIAEEEVELMLGPVWCGRRWSVECSPDENGAARMKVRELVDMLRRECSRVECNELGCFSECLDYMCVGYGDEEYWHCNLSE